MLDLIAALSSTNILSLDWIVGKYTRIHTNNVSYLTFLLQQMTLFIFTIELQNLLPEAKKHTADDWLNTEFLIEDLDMSL